MGGSATRCDDITNEDAKMNTPEPPHDDPGEHDADESEHEDEGEHEGEGEHEAA